MFSKLLSKIFGTKNDRELKKLWPLVQKVNELEKKYSEFSDEELKDQTNIFREQVSQGKALDDIMSEAFAVVREVSKRKRNERHFDVQIIGGAVLHQGKIAEMKTGEGKTLVATLPLYLNALLGKGTHLITVNDYLARKGVDLMEPIYNALGLEVGVIQNHMSDEQRRKAYSADITYGTNNEYGFDFLRDNMKDSLESYMQGPLHYAIVDEVDSILIDEARTPLIISGASEKGANLYGIANKAILRLSKSNFEIDEKEKSVHLTESGTDEIENLLNVANLYAPENILILHHVTQALRAHTLFKIDVDYVVREGEVLIVDEFTGRILPGRRFSDGLHQALEAKENVRVERENQTLATITLQNYFRMYEKLAGMTGTAMTEAGEFHSIYKLDVMAIPTNVLMIRKDEPDIIFLTKDDKFGAIIKDIEDCYERQQPVLVGTIAIETSEYLSYLLNKHSISHNILNAKQHEREAEIIAEAGQPGKVTIATNMAGRGTDIRPPKESLEAGGLRIIGTERHESRRIDNQLRGRSGRQGDPGSSKFYLSLEDDLMRIFGGEKLKRTMSRIGMEPGESIEHRMVTRSIEKAQEKVEKNNFDVRKHLLEYDNVLNQQRTVIYQYRREILEGAEHIKDFIKEMIEEVVGKILGIHFPENRAWQEKARKAVISSLSKLTNIEERYFEEIIKKSEGDVKKDLVEFLVYQHKQYINLLDEKLAADTEKWVLLETIDNAWKVHLQNIDHLKEGIGLRGYGQKNPLTEYKRESFHEFEKMMEQITWNIVELVFKMKPDNYSIDKLNEIEKRREKERADMYVGGDDSEALDQATVRRGHPKVGRNEPCPCGSRKKYKHCCGR
jgi:preprotein translocase subunit SecA